MPDSPLAAAVTAKSTPYYSVVPTPRLSAANRSAVELVHLLQEDERSMPGLDCRPPPPQPSHLPLSRTGRDAGTLRAEPLTFADIGMGMMLYPTPLMLAAAGVNRDGTAERKTAFNDDLFATLQSTWMPIVGPQLNLLVLTDCMVYCQRPKRSTLRLPSACHNQLGGLWRGHDNFSFPLPPWLIRRSDASLPQLQFRCYWGAGAFIGKSRALPTNIMKGAALQKAMLEALPKKRFYVKLDLDTLLRPVPLLNFLRFLDLTMHPDAPVYFGTTRLGSLRTWGFDVDRTRLHSLRNHVALVAPRAGNGSARTSRSVTHVFLRETEAWRALEATYMTAEQAEASVATKVNFAQGALMGLSHGVLKSMVQSNCMRRVSEVKCQPRCCRNRLIFIEDSVIGLCMHLLQVPLVDNSCIYTAPKKQQAMEELQRSHATPLAQRTPIAIHPIKDAASYRSTWRFVDELDRMRAKRLAAHSLAWNSRK